MIRKDILSFISTIPGDINVVAATKYADIADMKALYDAGIKDFGENRVDAFIYKRNALREYQDIKWHFIGHLQRNKAKSIINDIDYLHSLDSIELAKIINDNRITPLKAFIEISINLEENKNGVPYFDAVNFIKEAIKYPNIEVVGLMMMAMHNSVNPYEQFIKLKELRDQIENELQIKIPYLSMGMSEDYLEAIKAGATHIRLGRILFRL